MLPDVNPGGKQVTMWLIHHSVVVSVKVPEDQITTGNVVNLVEMDRLALVGTDVFPTKLIALNKVLGKLRKEWKSLRAVTKRTKKLIAKEKKRKKK